MNLRATTTTVAYIATIPAANLLVTHYGAVPVGFGLMAPAGVFMVGLALVLRDLVHEWAGRKAVLAAIAAGVGLSYLLAPPALATASAAAFGVAELADMAVYSPLRKQGLLLALAVSNAVGLVVDSLLFLQIAFGSQEFLWGQIVAKTQMTLLAAALLTFWVARKRAVNPPEIQECGCRLAQRGLCGHCRHDRCEDCGTCVGAGHAVHECPALIGGPA
jgi:queuosine precursor transporter